MTMTEGMVRPDALSVRDGRLAVAVHMPWYRSLPLSCLEAVDVVVDGVPAEVRSVRLPGFAGEVAEAAGSDATWDLRDALDVSLDAAGRPGERRSVEVRLAVRIPYLQVAPGVALVQRAVARTEGTPPMTRLAVGDPAPLFELPDVDGTTVRLDPAAAAATVVVFTANGCPYARAWHERLQAVARDYAPRDVTVLQIVSNDDAHHAEDSPESMRQRVAAGELAGPFLHDATQSVAQAYGATATPEVFVVDRAGVVRYHGAPDGDYDDPTLDAGWVREALDDVLAGREVGRPTTSPAGCSIKWRVELLWWEGCPSHDEAEELLNGTLDEIGKGDVHVVRREVRRRADAQALGFPGSPTFQVGGRDLFPADAPPALTCRVYRRADDRSGPLPDGAELADRLRDVLARPWELPGWVDFRKQSA